MIADNDADDIDVRKALAERYLTAGSPTAPNTGPRIVSTSTSTTRRTTSFWPMPFQRAKNLNPRSRSTRRHSASSPRNPTT